MLLRAIKFVTKMEPKSFIFKIIQYLFENNQLDNDRWTAFETSYYFYIDCFQIRILNSFKNEASDLHFC